MKILITGFDPFGGETINPAYEAVKRLPAQIGEAKLIRLEVPTEFSRCAQEVEEAIRLHRPDVALCIGQVGGRSCVTIERVAINLADAGIPDNAGEAPVDTPLQPDGPAAYFATIPVKALVRHIREGGIPCHLSYSAGTYVCNCLFYRVLHLAATKYPFLRAGFIHVPFSEAQAVGKPGGTPCASLSTLSRALALAVEALAGPAGEPLEGMGTLC